jgi:hypothetical protein
MGTARHNPSASPGARSEPRPLPDRVAPAGPPFLSLDRRKEQDGDNLFKNPRRPGVPGGVRHVGERGVRGSGIGFFGVTSLVLAWFGGDDPAIPVTELGYGALLGVIITTGIVVQVRAPERKLAGVQQAILGILALLISAPLASDGQNLAPGLALLAAMVVLIGLHPARRELVRRGSGFSGPLVSIAALGAIPLVSYALAMAARARELAGSPHHVQRLSWMAALAIAIFLVGLLTASRTIGWLIPARSAGAAAVVFGLASIAFPIHMGSAGRGWGAIAVAGGALFIGAAEWEAQRWRRGARVRQDQSHCL